ncbi:hypothetical protein DO021_07405 [Desulfobacter hydrogenophilus]|uniref:Uncharacterized protein n=1 Tax=Desulfobacter hydrogenophilus TaxID=2291 RepID=A0A328FGN4_9BACT|nr:hypothetical protein DO021_07405 [Desulfobacter hydrogenophilus]
MKKMKKRMTYCEGLSFNLKSVVRLVLSGLCCFALGLPPSAAAIFLIKLANNLKIWQVYLKIRRKSNGT